MKKLLLGLLTMVGTLHAQNLPGGQANLAGTLYASNFASWNVPMGNNGPLSWSFSSACNAATSGGVTFKPFVVGSPIRIIDTSPSLSETVTVTSVKPAGSGCMINVSPSNPHQNFYLTSATAGLQEAINFAGPQPYTVIVTPDFTRAGGSTGTITSAIPNTNVTILDERTSVVVPYILQGTPPVYTAQPFGSGGTPIPPSIPVLASNSGGTVQTANALGVAGLFCGTGGGFLKSDGTCGTAAAVPAPAFSVPFTNSGVTAFQTDNSFNFNTTNQSLQSNTFVATPNNPTLNSVLTAGGVYTADNVPNIDDWFHPVVLSGTGWNWGPSANVSNSFSTQGSTFGEYNVSKEGIAQYFSFDFTKRTPGDYGAIYCTTCYTVGGVIGNSDEGYTFLHGNAGEDPNIYAGNITASTAQGATFINSSVGGLTGQGLDMINFSQRAETGQIITGPTLMNNLYYQEQIGGATVTPSTGAGLLACPGGLAQLTNQSVPQSITCTVSQVPGISITPTFTTGVASLDGGFSEQVLITAVSGSSVTFTYRDPNMTAWAPNGTFNNFTGQVWDGTNAQRAVLTPPQNTCVTGTSAPSWNGGFGGFTTDGTCNWQNIGNASTNPGITPPALLWQGGSVQDKLQINDREFAITNTVMAGTCYGATDSTHIVCSQTIDGVKNPPNYSTIAPVALVNLSKTGTTVTATASSGVSTFFFNGVTSAVISGCSDSNLNGTVTAIVAGVSNIQWTQGGAGTGCTNATISLDPVAYQSISLFPYAEQVNGNNTSPTGANLAGTRVEPNIVTFNSGDLIQEQHPPSFSGAGIWLQENHENLHTFGQGILLNFTGPGAGNISPVVINNNAPTNTMLGAGGLITPQVSIAISGPNSGVIASTMPMNTNPAFTLFSPLNGIHCGTIQGLFGINADNPGQAVSLGIDACNQKWIFSTNVAVPSGSVQANSFLIGGANSSPQAGVTANDLGIDTPTSHTMLVGDGTAFSGNGAISTQEIYAPSITVGATAPTNVEAFPVGTIGSTSYSYSMSCNTVNGPGPISTVTTVNNGNATLDTTNFYALKGTPGGGCLSVDVYRAVATGPYAAGRICTAVATSVINASNPGCFDKGQATTGAIPGIDNSGNLFIPDGHMKLNGVQYAWPNSQAAGYLKNDGGGNVFWQANGFTGKCTAPQTPDFTNGIATGCS